MKASHIPWIRVGLAAAAGACVGLICISIWLWQTYFPKADLLGLLVKDAPLLAKVVLVCCLGSAATGLVLGLARMEVPVFSLAAVGLCLGLAGAAVDQVMIWSALHESGLSTHPLQTQIDLAAAAIAESLILAATGLLAAIIPVAALMLGLRTNRGLPPSPSATI